MPFITYTINKTFFENYKEIDIEKLSQFNVDVEDLNLDKKAILIENENYNIIEKLGKTINQIANDKIDSSLAQKKVLLENMLNNITKSLSHKLRNNDKNKISINFEKDKNNQFPREHKNKIIIGIFYPEDFDNKCDVFEKNFMDKLGIFIELKSKSNTDKIDKISIYHKELAKYLMPDNRSLHCQNLKEYKDSLDPKNDFYILENMKKIEYGVNLLYKWWKNLPDNIRPPNFTILSDFPPSLTKQQRREITDPELNFLQTNIENFLFFANDKNKNKAKVKIIKQIDIPSNQWWKHKRHWIFAKKMKNVLNKEDISFVAIKSDFGVEIVNPNNTSKLSKEMELTTVTNKNTKHMRDITDYLFNDAKKGTI